MRDIKVHLEKLQRDAAECRLIGDLATDADKRALFSRLADHYEVLARELQNELEKKLAAGARKDPQP